MLLLAFALAQDPEPLLYVQAGAAIKGVVPGETPAVAWTLDTPGFNAHYLRVSPDRKALYAAGNDRLRAFAIGADGRLTPSGDVPSPGGPCYVDVHPDGRRIATVGYGAGTTLLFAGLGEPLILPSGPQSHSVRFHPNGRFAYASSVAGAKITGFRLGEAPSSFELSMPGLGPRHLAFSPDGRLAFVVHERPIRVSSLTVDVETGALAPIGDVPALPAGAAEKKAVAAAEIAASPDGRFVYASVRDFSKEGDQNGLAVFAVRDAGRLEAVEFVPSGGVSPRGFVVEPSGKRLFVLNELSGTLVVFRIDATSGRLARIGEPLAVGKGAIGIAYRP